MMSNKEEKPEAVWHGNHINLVKPWQKEADRLKYALRAESYRKMSLKGDLLSLAGWLTFIAAIVIYAIVKS